MKPISRRILAALAGSFLPLTFTIAQAPSSPAPSALATKDIAASAQAFLATLDDLQRAKVVYDFKDDAQRKHWSNLPTSFVKRGSLRLGDLTAPQRDAAMAVVRVALSPSGYEKEGRLSEAAWLIARAYARHLEDPNMQA